MANCARLDGAPVQTRAFKNRDRATIMADILSSLARSPRGRRKTNIIQSANLSHPMSNKYLDLLLVNGLVRVENGVLYKPTTKGLRLLQNLDIEYLKIANNVNQHGRAHGLVY